MVCISTITRRASKLANELVNKLAAALLCLAWLAPAAPAASSAPAAQAACRGTIYLTFDTGSMSQAQLIADTLRQHHIKASFFLANEKTIHGDYSLDPAWAAFWRSLVADGHVFGSHSFDHLRWLRDLPQGQLQVRPQFGAQAGQLQNLSGAQYCRQLQSVDERFLQLTGRRLDPVWRAPAGATSRLLLQTAQQCGYTHFGWAQAGFSGDELPSERFPNQQLLHNMLSRLRDGDIVMAHLGIWSRRDPWAPTVLPALIRGLQDKGFCFATLRQHPDFPRPAQTAPAPSHPAVSQPASPYTAQPYTAQPSTSRSAP